VAEPRTVAEPQNVGICPLYGQSEAPLSRGKFFDRSKGPSSIHYLCPCPIAAADHPVIQQKKNHTLVPVAERIGSTVNHVISYHNPTVRAPYSDRPRPLLLLVPLPPSPARSSVASQPARSYFAPPTFSAGSPPTNPEILAPPLFTGHDSVYL